MAPRRGENTGSSAEVQTRKEGRKLAFYDQSAMTVVFRRNRFYRNNAKQEDARTDSVYQMQQNRRALNSGLSCCDSHVDLFLQ